MEKVRIEEFPHIRPEIVRALVIAAARDAQLHANRGANICGIGIQQKGNMLCSSTQMIISHAS